MLMWLELLWGYDLFRHLLSRGWGTKTRIGNLEKNIKPRKKLYKFPKIYVHILRFDNLSLNQLEIFKSKPS